MLKQGRKRLGLQDPAGSSRNRDDHPHKQKHRKNQHAMKTNSLPKISPVKDNQAAAQRENEKTSGVCCLSSNTSDAGVSEGKVNDKHSSNTSGSSEGHTDSELSDQESNEILKWTAALELNLKPEAFNEELDHHPAETAVYPEVLPASLLDSSPNPSSENQQGLFATDPCLAPVIARLMEFERLQAATVQKERTKLARSRPTTANTLHGNCLRKNDFTGCKTCISRDAVCSSVLCSFTKLMVCPNSSHRHRHHICPSTNSGQASRSKLTHHSLHNHSVNMSSKCKRAETFHPTLSVYVKVSQKPAVPNRTKSPKTQRGPTPVKKAAISKRKT